MWVLRRKIVEYLCDRGYRSYTKWDFVLVVEYVYRNRLLEDWRNSKNMGYHLMTVPAESKCSHGMTKKEGKRLCVKHVSSCHGLIGPIWSRPWTPGWPIRNNLHFIVYHKLFQSLLSMGKTRHSHQESSSSGGSDTVLGSEASISDWVNLPVELHIWELIG